MDTKSTTSLAIAGGLIAAFILGGITFAVAIPLTRAAAGMVIGGPAFAHGGSMGPMGQEFENMHGGAWGPAGGAYGLPGECDGARGEGMMPGQRGQMRNGLPEDHPRLDGDGQGRTAPGPRPECPADTL